MKTILTIVFLCSVAVSQQATAAQSSQVKRWMAQILTAHVGKRDCVTGNIAFETANGQAIARLVCSDGKKGINAAHYKLYYYPEISGKESKVGTYSDTLGKPATEKTEKK